MSEAAHAEAARRYGVGWTCSCPWCAKGMPGMCTADVPLAPVEDDPPPGGGS